MRADTYTKIVLTVIAVSLTAIALKPAANPAPVFAQTNTLDYYIEPQSTTIRKPDGSTAGEGKIVINPRTGDTWGFVTEPGYSYPIKRLSTTPPVLPPIYLGRFDFSAMRPQ
jgi:hypothetical protein